MECQVQNMLHVWFVWPFDWSHDHQMALTRIQVYIEGYLNSNSRPAIFGVYLTQLLSVCFVNSFYYNWISYFRDIKSKIFNSLEILVLLLFTDKEGRWEPLGLCMEFHWWFPERHKADCRKKYSIKFCQKNNLRARNRQFSRCCSRPKGCSPTLNLYAPLCAIIQTNAGTSEICINLSLTWINRKKKLRIRLTGKVA